MTTTTPANPLQAASTPDNVRRLLDESATGMNELGELLEAFESLMPATCPAWLACMRRAFQKAKERSETLEMALRLPMPRHDDTKRPN